jgi:hypothetical protein
MDEDTPEETRRLNEARALAPIELLRAVIAMASPVAVVLTVSASRIVAEGYR